MKDIDEARIIYQCLEYLLMFTKCLFPPLNEMYEHTILVFINNYESSLYLYIILVCILIGKIWIRCIYVEFLIIWSRVSFNICIYEVFVFWNPAAGERFPRKIINYCTVFLNLMNLLSFIIIYKSWFHILI